MGIIFTGLQVPEAPWKYRAFGHLCNLGKSRCNTFATSNQKSLKKGIVAGGCDETNRRCYMFYIFKKQKDINTTKIIDEIEASVYAALKPHEFKKKR